ncbi:PREDICTED: zinc finger protein 595-like [Rhagoletis zephyria]|uniref:zinc finger protein 595-like n=1 Tax=Rhagoletis zephyria TaxID=28612 RepID=UPI0008118C93|nr:PREDICTED: zinc finger protein 595-like [Rhagoletis zephyria]
MEMGVDDGLGEGENAADGSAGDTQEVKSIEINVQVIKTFFTTTISLYERLVKKSCKSCNLMETDEFIALHTTLCEFTNLLKIFNVSFDRTLFNNVITIKDEERTKYDIVQVCESVEGNTSTSATGSTKSFPCLVSSCHLKYCSEEASRIHFLKNHCKKAEAFEAVPHDTCTDQLGTLDFSQIKRDSEGRYVCETEDCNYLSADRSNFKVHYMRHNGNKKYICFVCSKSFFTRDPLMIHFLRLHMKEIDWSLAAKDIRELRKSVRRLTCPSYYGLASNDDINDSDTDLIGPLNEENVVLDAFISQAISEYPEVERTEEKEELQSDQETIDENGASNANEEGEPVNSFNVCLNLKDNDIFADSVTFKAEGVSSGLNDIITKSQEPNSGIKATMSLSATKDVMVNKEIKQRAKKYKCPHKNCHQDFFTKKNLIIHMKASHDPTNPLPCQEPGCTCRFKSQALLAQHQKRHRVSYNCKVCSYKTHLAALMTRHNRQHAGTHLFHECADCHEKFEFLGALSSHRRKMHNEKEPLLCDWTDCGKRFKTMIGLNKHRREFHLNMKAEIMCEWPDCKSVFSNRTAMNHHMRIHTNERPYQCAWQDCGKCFRLKETMKRHVKLHQGFKPYPCPFDKCDRAFVTKRNMRMHIEKIHLKPSSRVRHTVVSMTQNEEEDMEEIEEMEVPDLLKKEL